MASIATRERSVSPWADGSIELFAGVSVLGVGLCWLSGQPVFGAILPALSIPIWRAFSDRFLEPRRASGVESPGEAEGARRGAAMLLVAGIAALTVAVLVYRGVLARDATRARDLVAGLPAAILGMAALSAGLSFGRALLALYAVPCALAAALVVAVDLHPGHGLFACGIAPAVLGGSRLLRFFRDHPRRPGRLA